MILNKLLVSMMAIALSVSPMAVESSNSYYAYSTQDIAQMGIIQIDGQDYSLPLTMEQLADDGWEKSVPIKTKPGELFVVSRGDLQLSLSEDDEGRIERIVELYTAPGTLVVPGKAEIKAGISEEELVNRLEQLPLSWESAHVKNGTVKYKVTVPLGMPAVENITGTEAGKGLSASARERQDASHSYPACEYIFTVSSRLCRATEVRMVMDPGSDGWSNEVLGFRVAAYYAGQAAEIPPLFRVEEQPDGRVLVRLFEDLEDHIATWALYKADRTGCGFDEAFDPNEKKPIDFMR